jgi:hypothetical protein
MQVTMVRTLVAVVLLSPTLVGQDSPVQTKTPAEPPVIQLNVDSPSLHTLDIRASTEVFFPDRDGLYWYRLVITNLNDGQTEWDVGYFDPPFLQAAKKGQRTTIDFPTKTVSLTGSHVVRVELHETTNREFPWADSHVCATQMRTITVKGAVEPDEPEKPYKGPFPPTPPPPHSPFTIHTQLFSPAPGTFVISTFAAGKITDRNDASVYLNVRVSREDDGQRIWEENFSKTSAPRNIEVELVLIPYEIPFEFDEGWYTAFIQIRGLESTATSINFARSRPVYVVGKAVKLHPHRGGSYPGKFQRGMRDGKNPTGPLE